MIPPGVRANFATLLRAAVNGDLCLIQCEDAATGEPRYVIAAAHNDGQQILITPFGHMSNGNPYEEYISPC